MKFPKYWAHGESRGFFCWRSSDVSYEDAQGAAMTAAAAMHDQILLHGKPRIPYGYPDRPLREPILHEMFYPDGRRSAVVTRNSYGCDVLNTENAMFVDVDLAEEESAGAALGGMLGAFFSDSPTGAPLHQKFNAVIARAQAFAQSQPNWNWRVYRTRAGLRLLATHALFNSKDPLSNQSIFEAVGADPLYRRLCDAQESYRARLTPKPWRCGIPAPPMSWPFLNASVEQHFNEWQASYRAASNAYATCQLLPDIGSGFVAGALGDIIALHDNVSRATSGLPLA
jgi:hypothetical protein